MEWMIALAIFGIGIIILMEVLYKKVPGMPIELKKDGIYKIRIIEPFIARKGKQSSGIGILVLEKEGKADFIPPLYYIVRPSQFYWGSDAEYFKTKLKIGTKLTIRIVDDSYGYVFRNTQEI